MVLARGITLRFDPAVGRFDDMPLRAFLKDNVAKAHMRRCGARSGSPVAFPMC